MNIEDNGFGFAIGNLDETMVDFRSARRIKGIRVEIKRTGLERRLKNVGHVGEQDVVEEIAKLDVVYID
jgi:ribosomal protein L13E